MKTSCRFSKFERFWIPNELRFDGVGWGYSDTIFARFLFIQTTLVWIII